MAMLTWRELLDGLLATVLSANDLDAHANLRQLDGLVTQVDAEAFRPITSDELTGSIGRRILDYCEIIDKIIQVLLLPDASGVIVGDKKGLKAASGAGWYGHYIRLTGWGCNLRFSADLWATTATTPLWLTVKDRSWKASTTAREALAVLFSPSSIPRAFPDREAIAIALIPPSGEAQDAVIDSLLDQIRTVVALIRRYESVHPPEADADSLETPSEVTEDEPDVEP
jgi:hypothetical protein